jgi:hypothetical protein
MILAREERNNQGLDLSEYLSNSILIEIVLFFVEGDYIKQCFTFQGLA